MCKTMNNNIFDSKSRTFDVRFPSIGFAPERLAIVLYTLLFSKVDLMIRTTLSNVNENWTIKCFVCALKSFTHVAPNSVGHCFLYQYEDV